MDGTVPEGKPWYLLEIDDLVAPPDEVEVVHILNVLSSSLREATDKFKVLDKLHLEDNDLLARSAYRQQWKLYATLKANEVPEVALLLKIIIAQQAGYEELVQRTEKIRHFHKYDHKYYEDARLAMQTLEQVKAALNGSGVSERQWCPTESFWQSMRNYE